MASNSSFAAEPSHMLWDMPLQIQTSEKAPHYGCALALPWGRLGEARDIGVKAEGWTCLAKWREGEVSRIFHEEVGQQVWQPGSEREHNTSRELQVSGSKGWRGEGREGGKEARARWPLCQEGWKGHVRDSHDQTCTVGWSITLAETGGRPVWSRKQVGGWG